MQSEFSTTQIETRNVFKTWFCQICGNSIFKSHLIEERGVNINNQYSIVPPECCDTIMLDDATLKVNKSKNGITIIKDIEPYLTVAADKNTKQICYISSRREHNEFLKRNDYVEIGNELPTVYKQPKFQSPINKENLEYAIHHAPQITQSDEFKQYIHNAQKEIK